MNARPFAAAASAAMLAATSPLASASQEVTVTHSGVSGDLAGSLEGEFDAAAAPVLIVPGSGPTDRDGNNPMGVKGSTYRLLAEALAQQGIASVRIDKRGMFASSEAVANANEVTIEDYAADIAAWSAMMQERSGAPCVWLLGHSEGGLVAMAAAAADAEPYCGLLLVSSVGRPVGETLRDQLAAAPGVAPLMGQVDAHIAALSAGESVAAEDIHPGLLGLFGPQIQTFMISLLSQRPAELLAVHELPVLILSGREDLQTTEKDALALAEARPDADLVLLDGVNHVLKHVEGGDRAANLASYADPDLPLAPGVADAIVNFIQRPR